MRETLALQKRKKFQNGQIEPAEVFGVALVLQVMKDGDLAAAADERRGEAGIEEDVETEARGGQRQGDLFPQQTRGPVYGADGLRHMGEVGGRWNQRSPGLAVGEDEVLVLRIDFGERGKQGAQINFGAADTAGNQVKRVDADPHD